MRAWARFERRTARSELGVAAAWALSRGYFFAYLLVLRPLYQPFFGVKIFQDVVHTYHSAALLMSHGHLPYEYFTYEYPPVSLAWVYFAGLFGLGTQSYLVGWMVGMLVVDLAVVVGCSKLRGPWKRQSTPMLWYLLATTLLGPLTLVRNDLLVVVFVVWAMAAFQKAHWKGVGALLMLGALAKLWPILLLALAVAWMRRDEGAAKKLLGGGALVLAPVTVLLAVTGTLEGCINNLRSYHGERGLEIESGAGNLGTVLRALRGQRAPTEFTYGSVNLRASGYTHLAQPLSTALGVCVVLGALALAWKWAPQWQDGRATAQEARAKEQTIRSFGALCLALMMGSLLTSKVFSPQYGMWLIAVSVIALPGLWSLGSLRRGMVLGGIALTLGLTQLDYPVVFPALLDGKLHAVLAVTARNGALLASFGLLLILMKRAGSSVEPAPTTQTPGSTSVPAGTLGEQKESS